MSVLGDIVENVAKAAIHKQLERFVAKRQLTETEAAELTTGIMLEIKLGLEMYQSSQTKAGQ